VNPADERVEELLEKWLASLELHLKYVSLDEPDYRKAQPWPEHDRPSRWIIEVAKGKARELRDQVAARIATGDATFCESLELMAFLVNLVGARVDRFIPLADVASEVDVSTAKQPAVAAPAPAPSPPTPPPPPPPPAAPVIVPAPAPRPTPAAAPPPEQSRPEQDYAPPPAPVFKAPLPVATPTAAAAPPSAPIGPARTAPAIGAAPVVLVAPTLPSAPPAPVIPPPLAPPLVQSPPPAAEATTAVRLTASGEQRALAAALDATREMPRPVLSGPEHASDPDDTVETPRAKTDARKVTRRETKARAPAERATSTRDSHAKEKDMNATVIADAVRLIVWGRKWHELVELIGRFAERPSATEIRRILKEHRASIEKTAEKERSKKKK
jgi:hypothetical protein